MPCNLRGNEASRSPPRIETYAGEQCSPLHGNAANRSLQCIETYAGELCSPLPAPANLPESLLDVSTTRPNDRSAQHDTTWEALVVVLIGATQ